MGIYTDHFNGPELERVKKENIELGERLQQAARDYRELKTEIDTKLRVKEVVGQDAEGNSYAMCILNAHHTTEGVRIEIKL